MPSVSYISIRDLVGLTIKSTQEPRIQATLITRIKSFIEEAGRPMEQARLDEIVAELGKDSLIDESVEATKHIIKDRQALMMFCTSVLSFFEGGQPEIGADAGGQVRTTAGGQLVRRPTTDEATAWDMIYQS